MPTDTHSTPGITPSAPGGWTPSPPTATPAELYPRHTRPATPAAGEPASGRPEPSATTTPLQPGGLGAAANLSTPAGRATGLRGPTLRRRQTLPGAPGGEPSSAVGLTRRRPPSAPTSTARTPEAAAEARRRRARARALRLTLARHRPLVLVLCVVAAVMATTRALTPPQAPTRPVTVAAHDLGAGHVIADGDLRTVHWPADLSPPPSGASTSLALAGRTLTGAVRAGEPVTDARLLGPGALAGQATGTLAVPVRLADPTTAGIVAPGDHVDVIAGTTVEVPGMDAGPAHADVVAWDVVVLATPGRDAGSLAQSRGGLSALTESADDESIDSGGLLVVAADRATAVRLARAQAGKVLSVAVRAPPGDAGSPP